LETKSINTTTTKSITSPYLVNITKIKNIYFYLFQKN